MISGCKHCRVPPIPGIGIGIGMIPIPIPVSVSVSVSVWQSQYRYRYRYESSAWYRYRYRYRYRYESFASIGIGIGIGMAVSVELYRESLFWTQLAFNLAHSNSANQPAHAVAVASHQQVLVDSLASCELRWGVSLAQLSPSLSLLFFLFCSPSRPFLIERLFEWKSVFSESCSERPKT